MSEDALAPTTPVRREQAVPAAKLVAWAGLVTALIAAVSLDGGGF